jgi:hypothetical protein
MRYVSRRRQWRMCVVRRGRISGGCVFLGEVESVADVCFRRGKVCAGCPDLAQPLARIVWDEIPWTVIEYYGLPACDAV